MEYVVLPDAVALYDKLRVPEVVSLIVRVAVAVPDCDIVTELDRVAVRLIDGVPDCDAVTLVVGVIDGEKDFVSDRLIVPLGDVVFVKLAVDEPDGDPVADLEGDREEVNVKDELGMKVGVCVAVPTVSEAVSDALVDALSEAELVSDPLNEAVPLSVTVTDCEIVRDIECVPDGLGDGVGVSERV